MKKSISQKSQGFLRNLAGSLLLVAAVVLASVTPAAATNGGTSAGATIHNLATVTYQLGASGTATAYGYLDITVLTVPTTPTWYAASGKTVGGGAFTTYSSSLRSNANGPDSYTVTETSSATHPGASIQTGQTLVTASPVTLWGGITTQAATAGVLYFPGGSLATHPVASGTILEITVGGVTKQYTAGATTPGAKNSLTGTSGSAESPDQLAVTAVSGVATDEVGPGNFVVPAGTQIGEVKRIGITLTAGTPTVVGTTGYNNSGLSAIGIATDRLGATAAAATANIQTTITSIALTFTKKSRIIHSGAAINGTSNIDTTLFDATTKQAKSGETIEYLLTVSNPAGNTPSNNINVKDPTPTYTTVVSGSESYGVATNATTTITGVATSLDSAAVWSGGGYTHGSALPAGSSLHIVYQVTVN